LDSKKTILIIDDSNINVVLLEALLFDNGYSPLTCYSVKEALNILENITPDMIILDLLMPFTDGYAFLKIIRENNKTKGIPVLVFSAVSTSEGIKKATDFGLVDFICKPGDMDNIIKVIADFFHR